MADKKIVVKQARENNLKNLTVEIPKEKLVVFTGLSGSGKTTLAFDTIYKEGQRRYVESLSSYARQFLGNIEKPDVESIEGLSPSISIDQKTTSHNPRSTVGTVTEIYDYLRLLYARIGVPYCPNHDEPIISYSPTQITAQIQKHPLNTKLQILAPIIIAEKGTHKDTIAKIKANGFERLRVDKTMVRIDDIGELDKNRKHSLDIIIDRITLKDNVQTRIFEAVELALDWARGYVIALFDDEEILFSQHHACKHCGFSVAKLEPRLFSFNSPLGYCPDCNGLGIKREGDPDLLVPNPDLTINQGAIEHYKNTAGTRNLEWQEFSLLCQLYDIPLNVAYRDLSDGQKKILMFGSPNVHKYVLKSSSGNINHRNNYIEGIKTKIERLYHETTSEMMREYYERFLRDRECTACHGARLNEQVLAVKIDNLNIYQVTTKSVTELDNWISQLPDKITSSDKEIARLVIEEIKNRASFLINVGLNYLTLARMAMTLSGGEAQRIRLATQIGSRLTGVLYVLDEPSIGLHQRDNKRLIKTLKDMRDLGNTLIVVEHDEETIKEADYIIDIGPGAGMWGGEVVATGKIDDLINEPRSITGDYLAGRKFIACPDVRIKGNGYNLEIVGARCNNLKNIDVKIPLGCFVAVTGVSGSGKSSLITEILYKAVARSFNQKETFPGNHDRIDGLEHIDKCINISQDPIGRTPRSNPATYTKAFDEIRSLFAETHEARARGYSKGRFSFNVPGGRCENCQGDGVRRIPMNFLPDVYVKCDVCQGKRYNDQTLQVTYKGKSIHDVLEMTVEKAVTFFENRPLLLRRLQTLNNVGLGYIKLGQPAPTLSGGEAQRVKLAFELQKRPTGKTLYILDEPTTGLHVDDVARLLDVLRSIVNHGDTVVVIEHNLDVIKVTDYIIDLGPEGGDGGGQVIATGTPEQIADSKKSYTGVYLKQVLATDCKRKGKIVGE